jgi:hypothetical protein
MAEAVAADIYLGANAPIERPPESAIQPDDEVQEIKMIMAWQREAANSRSQFDKHWNERKKAYKGKTWQAQKSSDAKQTPEMNLIRVVVQTILPILTDSNPGFNVLPRDPTDIKFTQMLSDSLDSLWDRRGMPTRIVEVLMDQSILDNGVLKVLWNADLEDGHGDIDIEVKDPENIWVNKGAIDFDRECKYVIERFVKTVGEWKRMFPKDAPRINADSTSEQRQKDEGDRPTSEVTLVSPVDQDKNKNADAGEGVGDDNGYAEGWEVWYEDSTMEEFDLTDKEGNPTGEKGQKKKFPNGHLTTILPHQKIRLQSVENPNEGPNFNPYVRFVDTIMPRQFYGEGLVESLIDIQKMLNKVAQTIVEYMRLMSNPIWIADKTSGVNWDKVTNKVGLIIQKEAGTEVRRDIPPPIPGYIFEFFRLLQGFANEVSGVHDVTQGRKPAGVTAAEAIETLQEAAHTRVRLKERNMQVSLSKLAKLVISMMLQKYRAPRYHRVAGSDAEVPTFVEFGIDDTIDGNLTINRRTWAYDPAQGKYVATPLEAAQAKKGLFDVKVQAGTSMPFAKASRSSLAIRLAEGGFIDQTALLKTLEWEDQAQVIQRMKEEKAAAAQLTQPTGV